MEQEPCIVVVDVDAEERTRVSAELRSTMRCIVNAHDSLDAVVADGGIRPRMLVLGVDPERVIEWTLRAREVYQDTTLVVTGYFPAITAFDIARAGADLMLLKPVSAFQLRSMAQVSPDPSRHTWPSLARVEWEYMQAALRACHGNRSETARRLRIHRSVLQRKLSRHPPAR